MKTCFHQGPDERYCRFHRSHGLCCNYPALSLQRGSSRMETVNKGAWRRSNKGLFTKPGGWLDSSAGCHLLTAVLQRCAEKLGKGFRQGRAKSTFESPLWLETIGCRGNPETPLRSVQGREDGDPGPDGGSRCALTSTHVAEGRADVDGEVQRQRPASRAGGGRCHLQRCAWLRDQRS